MVAHACNPSIQEVEGVGMLQVSEPAWSTQRSRLAHGYLTRSCQRRGRREGRSWETYLGDRGRVTGAQKFRDNLGNIIKLSLIKN